MGADPKDAKRKRPICIRRGCGKTIPPDDAKIGFHHCSPECFEACDDLESEDG